MEFSTMFLHVCFFSLQFFCSSHCSNPSFPNTGKCHSIPCPLVGLAWRNLSNVLSRPKRLLCHKNRKDINTLIGDCFGSHHFCLGGFCVQHHHLSPPPTL